MQFGLFFFFRVKNPGVGGIGARNGTERKFTAGFSLDMKKINWPRINKLKSKLHDFFLFSVF